MWLSRYPRAVDVVFVAIGGALGAVARFVVDRGVTNVAGAAGWGTLVVNLSGAFAAGLFVALVAHRGIIPEPLRLPIGVGFLGAYTTFSTWMVEAVRTAETGDVPWAVANVAGSVLLGLVAVSAGLLVGRSVA